MTRIPAFRIAPRALAILLVLGALIAPNWRSLPAAAAAADQPPLDLAAMILTPADLAAAGQEGFGTSSGRTLSVDSLADRATWPEGQGERFVQTHDALLAAGWSQGYGALLTTIRDFDNPGPIRDIEIEVDAYADANGASAAFALVPDAYATGEMTDIPTSDTIGAESRITRVEAHDPGAGTPAYELALGFRLGRLTARVVIRDQGERQPQVDEIEALAEALITKIPLSLASGPSALGLHALRVAPKDDMTYAEDGYLRLDGQDARSAFESPDEFAARAAPYGDAIDVFSSSTEIGAADSTYNLVVRTTLFRFATEDQASSWLQAAPDSVHNQADVTEFTLDPHLVDPGDETAAITVSQDRGGAYPEILNSAIVFVRVGTVVAEVRLERLFDAPSISAALELAGQQATCLGQSPCPDPLSVAISQSGELDESPSDHQAGALKSVLTA